MDKVDAFIFVCSIKGRTLGKDGRLRSELERSKITTFENKLLNHKGAAFQCITISAYLGFDFRLCVRFDA